MLPMKNAPRPSQSPANTYQYPAPVSRSPVTTHQVYRPNSPYLPQQQRSQQPQPSRTHKATSTATNNTTATPAAVAATHDHRSANVGQLRAPSLTPSAVQRQGHQHQHSTTEPLAHTTVDPSQVYDAWPEQQRRIREAEARRKANEEAKRAKAEREENERKAAEAKRLAEEKKAEDARREQEARKAEAERKAESARTAEAERRAAAERKAAATDEAVQVRARAMGASRSQSNALPSEAALAFAGASGAAPGSDLEAEMLAMFKKMREFNEKNPTMLARLWDQERRAHLAKATSPSSSSSSSSHAQPAQSTQSTRPTQPAQSAQPAQLAQPARSQQSPVQHSQTPHPAASSTQSSASKPSSRSTFAPSKASAAAGPKPNTSFANPVSGGNAIWPPGKKAHLAEAAAKWLNSKPENADKHVTGDRLVSLLDSNPSYSTLCETLERMGLVVDRGSFARALLSAMPDTNKATAARHAVSTTSGGAATVTSATTAANPAEASSSSGGDPTTQRGPNSQPRPKNNGPPHPPNKSEPRAKGKRNASQSSVTATASGPTTTTATPPGTDGPSLANMYRTALAGDQPSVVAYESRPNFYPPPDDDYYHDNTTPQVSQAPQATMTAPQSTASPYFQQSMGRQPLGQQARQTPRPTPVQVPRRAPANKEEAARKRTFAELVDLTAVDDASDEELEPPAKLPNLHSLAATFDMAPTVNSYAGNSTLTNDQGQGAFQRYTYDGKISDNFTPATALAPQPAMESVRQAQMSALPTVTSLEQDLSGKTLVQGIQRERVARKSHYDPRTICRDVLLATGRHPEMRALNQHLFDMHEFLKKHSTNVEGDKLDLNTIRWNLIDPGEPIAIHKPSEVDMDADDEDEDGDSGEIVSAKDSTRHGPAHGRKAFRRRGVGRARKTMSRGESIGGTSGRAESRPPAQTAGANATPTSTSTRSIPAPGVISFTPVNKSTRMQTTPLSAPVGYAAFYQKAIKYDENGKPIKRIGRPVGWRKSIHSKAAVAAAASGQAPPIDMSSFRKDGGTSSRGRGQGRRGRPSKQAQAAMYREPEAEFNVYKCQWEECKAELHNVDTLRKHVIKLHGKKTAENDYECFWKECFFDRSGEQDEPFIFERMEEWMEHMESMHIVPVARRLGDGPRLGLSEPHDSEQSDAYLSDATGRIVTPRIEAGEIGEGSRESEAQMAARRMTNLSGVRLENEKLLQQIEQQKRVIGPGLDRGGCTFATAQRRRGFYDDEDFEEVIEPDEIEE